MVLWFAGPTQTSVALGTWLQTIVQDARHAKDTVPIIVIGLERAIMGESSAAQIVEDMRKAVGDRVPSPRLIELGTEEAEHCLAVCPFAEPDAIVAILDVERLRFAGIEPSGPIIESVDGSLIRVSEKDSLRLPHVTKLCAEICVSALGAGQKWLIVSRGYGFGGEIPCTLTDKQNLQICQLTEEPHSPTHAKEFREMLALLPSTGADVALRWVAERLPAGKLAAIAQANVLSLTEQPVQAYSAIKVVAHEILREGRPEEIIQLAQMALSAGLAKDALKWVRHLPKVGTLEFENLRATRLLCYKLGADDLRQDCVAEFRRRFPSHPLTQLDHFNELLNVENYAAAAKQADETGHPFRREVALFLANPTEPPNNLLKAAALAGEMADAYWTVAKSAKKRKDYSVCRKYLRLLTDDERNSGDAVAMRAEILGAQIPDIDQGTLQDELLALLS
ncbi:MAG TPA: hypothetical protein PK879_02410 [Opitutaceae bacterium]|nr:hypothetical protein [Opitutaceae bacterium]